jgi:Tol biopolymer transport system component
MNWRLKLGIGYLLAVLFLASCSGGNGGSQAEQSGQPLDVSRLRAESKFSGKIAFQSDMDGDNEIYLLTEEKLRKLTDNSWNDEYPQWSPDGTKIAFNSNPEGKFEVFIMNEDGGGLKQITQTQYDAVEHAWLPDGEKMAYTIERKRVLGKSFALWMIDLKSGRTKKIIPDFPGSNALPNFSSSAPLMGFTGKRTIGWDVFMYDLEKKEYRSLTEGGKSCRPHFSRDGRRVAYVSSEKDGKGDIWVMNPDGSNKERITERDETYDYFPSWSKDGQRIVFSTNFKHGLKEGNWDLYLVEVRTKTVVPLFRGAGRDLFPDWY